MKKVIITEKPSVARNIADALGIKSRKNGYIENESYVITWVFGHLPVSYTHLDVYKRQDLTWREFLRFSRNGKDKKEIRTRLEQLQEPLQIEMGYNDVMAGRYEEGITRLEPFLQSRFRTWWPLYYYLGVAYEMTGRKNEAISSFKKVLTMNASHLETMEELSAIYAQEGDRENKRKYCLLYTSRCV